MRTTVRIDDDLLRTLKERAHKQGISLARLLNQVIRRGLGSRAPRPRRSGFRQKVFDMGTPLVPLDKALSLAAALEDEEIIRKLSLRK